MPEYRGAGLGRWLMSRCLGQPVMSASRRIMRLATYAPWRYEKMGYELINKINTVWNISGADVYLESWPGNKYPLAH